MKHVMIGTAGHIDHGKTALVKALTGTDTDRLAEEKRRGITIDLGFAQMVLPGGTLAGIVDVPGHEKFIRNMLAGAGAIDLALMVVAADEGVMPQTREHLDILTLLGVQHGVVALTKCDLVDEETLELAKEDLREAFAGSFLQKAPVVEVSAVTGMGISALREALLLAVGKCPERGSGRPFRMPVDRVFTVDGFGTVVTGTVLGGTLSVGDPVVVCPQGLEARVRGLQSGGTDVAAVFAGQRAAANLGGIKRENIGRGSLLACRVLSCTRLDVRLDALPTAHILHHGSRLHLAIGTASVVCRLILLDQDMLYPGESAYAQLRLEQPVAAQYGDRFVVRFYSPLLTVGGGIVLDACPNKHKRSDPEVLSRLHCYRNGTLSDQLVYELSHALYTRRDLRERFLHCADAAFDEAWQVLLDRGMIMETGGLVGTPALMAESGQAILKALAAYHLEHPLSDGFPLSEMQKCFPAALMESLLEKGMIVRRDAAAALPEFVPLQTDAGSSAREKLLAAYRAAGFAPPAPASLAEKTGIAPEMVFRMLELLRRDGELICVGPELFFLRETVDCAKEKFETLTKRQESVRLSELRDALGASRKYTQAILEYFDEIGYTVKDGDVRRLK
ncbi:selenocysteine-specific translation elongation factor [Anaerotruncus rubiinfantis]|uniref:selenocysteine-specific translation elongation factor n=1 Tax=Anaerotruncus rubiinfantis TaxID=1720200 RepID=UPI0034A30CA0